MPDQSLPPAIAALLGTGGLLSPGQEGDRDSILQDLRRYDPDASYALADQGGGEGGGGGQGIKFNFDAEALKNAPKDVELKGPALEGWLHGNYTGTNAGLGDELYQARRGDDMLANLQKYDPDAKWEEYETGGGGEGGGPTHKERRLVFDPNKLPRSEANEKFGWDVAPAPADNSGDERMRDPSLVYDDPIYGRVTDKRNLYKHQDNLDKYGPAVAAMAISMIAPMAAPALFGAMGAGATAAGFTSAATAGAAGLGAGATPGAFGAGTFTAANAPAWTKLLTKPSTIKQLGQMGSAGKVDLSSALSMAIGASGLPGGIPPAALNAILSLIMSQGKR